MLSETKEEKPKMCLGDRSVAAILFYDVCCG